MKKIESKNGEYDAEWGKCMEGYKECYDENTFLSCQDGYYKVNGNELFA